MPRQVVILSGPVGSGKTTCAAILAKQYGLLHFKSSDYLLHLAQEKKIPAERKALQRFGEKLDKVTEGRWVLEGLTKQLDGMPADVDVVVDAARIQAQIDAIRKAFGQSVAHIHLKAPDAELAKRYTERAPQKIKELPSYDEVKANPTERRISRLEHDADGVIDTSLNRREDVAVRVASHLGLYGREYLRLVDVLIGGQYGSEGKGQVAAYLSREYDVLVRVGGPNAGHSVRIGDSKKVFHHLPSGSLSSSAQLVLGPGAVVNVENLMKEIGDFDVEPSRLSIDPQVMTISANDIRQEIALAKSIGSTKQGVGLATARRIAGRGRKSMGVKLAKDIRRLLPYVRDTCEVLERAYNEQKRVFLEGTQGTGLSLYHGSYPHVTSRDTTVAGCLAEAGISPSRVRKVIMVCRSYPIRVQNPDESGRTSGFMSQEISWEDVAKRAGLDPVKLREAEKTTTTKRDRRVSEFDWALLRKSATLNAPTDVALTFADYVSAKNQNARRFEQLTRDTIRFVEEIERVAAAPVTLISTRFHTRSIIDRRSWRR